MRRATREGAWFIAGAAVAALLGLSVAVRGMIRGQVTIDLGIGRSLRSLGPISVTVAAPREVVFDAAAAPYGAHPPRAARDHVQVLHRTDRMVLAAHRTPVGRTVAVTVETVTLERPMRMTFRLVRGPVPYVVEEFAFDQVDGSTTTLTYTGELGTDLWGPGRAWGALVAPAWERAVRRSVEQIRAAAENRAGSRGVHRRLR
jgi:hypothetical protein